MEKAIDDELLEICKEIKKMNYSLNKWKEIESCDMFQTEHYCGGFEADDEAFWFSYFDDSRKEYYFRLTLDDIMCITQKKLNTIILEEPK